MNSMADLRVAVAARLRSTLHGREIDEMRQTVEIPQMLGVIDVGEPTDKRAERGTILDPQHDFWQNYHESVETREQVFKKVQTAIRSLKEDGSLTITYPYGEEADIAYVEVETLLPREESDVTECLGCGETIDVEQKIEPLGGKYSLNVTILCPHCGEGGVFKTVLHRE